MSQHDHIPVLPDQTLQALAPKPGQTYLDCTVGRGGHAESVARILTHTGTLILNDLDNENLQYAAARISALTDPPKIHTIQGSFAALAHTLPNQSLRADLLVADLGFASNQVDQPHRGLSFSNPGPLDMRLDQSSPTTAATLIASLSENDLTQIIRDFGEERHARLAARAIVTARTANPIQTTDHLASIVRSALGAKYPPPGQGIDPATRTFQALRIAVNDELGHLSALLDNISWAAQSIRVGKPTWLNPKARIAILTFHSLEDRPVKQAFASMVKAGLATEVIDGVQIAQPAELAQNPRSRSAKLRAIELI